MFDLEVVPIAEPENTPESLSLDAYAVLSFDGVKRVGSSANLTPRKRSWLNPFRVRPTKVVLVFPSLARMVAVGGSTNSRLNERLEPANEAKSRKMVSVRKFDAIVFSNIPRFMIDLTQVL